MVRGNLIIKGVVTGKHGGIEHVMIDFPPETLDKLQIGDWIQVRGFGTGIERILLACDADIWGQLDDRAGTVQIHAARETGDEELLDAAARMSLRHGGTVYGLDLGEVPGGGALAAVFRY